MICILYDVYKAWHSVEALLDSLKNQVPKLVIRSPKYSKEEVLLEGELAHSALFEFTRSSIEEDDNNQQSSIL